MKIDLVNPYLEDGRIHNNCSKYLLYNDPLIGTFDSVVKEDTAERFAQAEIYMEQAASHGCLAYMFNNMQLLCIVLKHKADLGIRIRKAYTEGEKKRTTCNCKGRYPGNPQRTRCILCCVRKAVEERE